MKLGSVDGRLNRFESNIATSNSFAIQGHHAIATILIQQLTIRVGAKAYDPVHCEAQSQQEYKYCGQDEDITSYFVVRLP